MQVVGRGGMSQMSCAGERAADGWDASAEMSRALSSVAGSGWMQDGSGKRGRRAGKYYTSRREATHAVCK